MKIRGSHKKKCSSGAKNKADKPHFMKLNGVFQRDIAQDKNKTGQS